MRRASNLSHTVHYAPTQASLAAFVPMLAAPFAPKPSYTLTAATAQVGEGKTEVFTLHTTLVPAGTMYNYVLSGPGTDQVQGSLTGSVVVGANGLSYIAVTILDNGQMLPDQALTLTVAGKSDKVTVVDTASSATSTYALTSGRDNLTLTTTNNLVSGTFGTVTAQGTEAGGTFSVGDYIDGGTSHTTTLSLYQNFQSTQPGQVPYDVLPVGVTVKNVGTLLVNSVQSLGSAQEAFDTTKFDGGTLSTLNIQNTLGSDYVLASAVTNVSLTDDGGLIYQLQNGAVVNDGGNVTLDGGHNVTVSTTGVTAAGLAATVQVGGSTAPTGSITITDTDQVQGSDILAFGGTSVNALGYGNITTQQTGGGVVITDLGTVPGGGNEGGEGRQAGVDDVSVNGATTVSVAASGGNVNVVTPARSGTISITDLNAAAGSNSGTVSVTGGANVTVNASAGVFLAGETGKVVVTSGSGSVSVLNGTSVVVDAHGAVTIGSQQAMPVGTVTVTDSGGQPVLVTGGLGDTVTADGQILVKERMGIGALVVSGTSGSTVAGGITAQGGDTVNVTNVGGYYDEFGGFHPDATAITVGARPQIQTLGDGTQAIGNLVLDATGNVVVNDGISGLGVGVVTIDTDGAKSVSVTGGTAGGIADIQSLKLVRSPGAAATQGTSTLAAVLLDGVAGQETVATDALKTLSIADSGANQAGLSVVTVQDRTAGALGLALANDAAGTALTDDTATSVAATIGGGGAALLLTATQATALSVAGSAVLNLTGASGLGSLTTITVTGAAGLNDGGVATGLGTYGSLTSIDGTATSGALTVSLGANQAFAGGSGLDTVTLSADALAKVNGGSGAANVIVANAAGSVFTAKDTGANVTGFAELRTTASSTGTYDMVHVFNGIANIDVAAMGKGAETFTNTSTMQTLSIDQSIGSSGVTLVLPQGTMGAASLALSLGTAATAGIDVSQVNEGGGYGQLLSVEGYTSIALASAGGVDGVTGVSLGTNTADFGDKALTSLSVSGAESADLASTGSLLSTIGITAAASATINLDRLGLTLNGATVTDGAAGIVFLGNVQSLKTDHITFTSNNTDANAIVEQGTGALQVDGRSDNGNTNVTAVHGVLDATLGNGTDIVHGSDATTSVVAGDGAGDQVISAQSGNGTLSNTITLGSGAGDLVRVGGRGADTITLGSGAGDMLVTSDGSGTLTIGAGAKDTVSVGNGNDTIGVGAGVTNGTLGGSATITVGAGTDTITAGSGTYAVTFGTGTDTLSANLGATNPGGVTVSFGGEQADASPRVTFANDSITLGNGTNMIGADGTGAGADGSNTVSVGSGTNTIVLGSGNNSVMATDGKDSVTLGDGSNTVTLGGGTDTLVVGGGNNMLTLGAGNDHVTAGNGNNTVSVGNGNDMIQVGTGQNMVHLGSGTDTVSLTGPGANSAVFTTITGALVGDTIAFLGTNGTGAFANGSAAEAQVSLPGNATFQDYLNAATFGDGSHNSSFAYFTLGGSQYLVEDNSAASTFVAGQDTVLSLGKGSLNLADMTLNATGHAITFHA